MPIRHNWNKFRIRHGAIIRDCLFVLCALLFATAMIWMAIWIAHVIADRNQMQADQQAEAQAYKVALEGEKWKDEERQKYIAEAMKTPWEAAILRSK